MLKIGPYTLQSNVVLAPMAGITDNPFRKLCQQFGAGLTTSEMTSAQPQIRHTHKSIKRRDHTGEPGPISVQIAGTEPQQLADAAKFNVEQGAQIIDINMGCPAKKVCQKAAGSALLRDERLVANILSSVVNAVNIPITLKIRTGWDKQNRNATTIAKIAEDCGIQALAVHGRTKECAFKGEAEYETIAAIKQSVNIPIIANGDITTPQKAAEVLEKTQADAIMIGRGAQGRPWIFQEIIYYLKTQKLAPILSKDTALKTLIKHIKNLHEFYGEEIGCRVSRKHIKWYLKTIDIKENIIKEFMQITHPQEQIHALLKINA